MMSPFLRKALFAGSALVALGAAVPAQASTQIVNGSDIVVNSDPNATPAIEFQSDNIATINGGVNITGTIVADAPSTGILRFLGSTIVEGDVGSATNALNRIDLFTQIEFKGVVYTDGFAGPLDDAEVTFDQDVYALLNGLNFGTSPTSGTVNLADGVTFHGDIVNTVSSEGGQSGGILTLWGDGVVTGIVGGGPGRPLDTINAGVDGSSSTFENTVMTATANITGDGTVTFDQSVETSGVNFLANGTVVLTYGYSLSGPEGGNTLMVGAEAAPPGGGHGNVLIQGGDNGTFNLHSSLGGLNSLTLDGTGNTTTVTGNVNSINAIYLGTNSLVINGGFTEAAGDAIYATITGEVGSTLTGGNITVAGSEGGGTVNLDISPSTAVYLANNSPSVHAGDVYTLVTCATACSAAIGTGITPVSPGLSFTQVTSDPNVLAFTVSAVTPAGGLSNAPLFYMADLPLEVLDVTSDELMAVRDGNPAVASAMTGMSAGYAAPNVIYFSMPSGYRTIGDRDGKSPVVNTTNAWMQAYGQLTTQDTHDGYAGYHAIARGMSAGVDTISLIKDTIVGIAANFISADLKSKNNEKAEVESRGIIVYGGHELPYNLFTRAQAGYSYNTVTTKRYNSDGVGGESDGNYGADQYYAKALVGRDYVTNNGTILTPNVVADYIGLHTQDYTETGSSLSNLSIASETFSQLRAGPGLDMAWRMQNANGGVFQPLLRVLYQYDILGNRQSTAATPVGGGGAIIADGPSPARNIIRLGAQATYMTVAGWDISARYDFTYKTDYHANDGLLRATLHF